MRIATAGRFTQPITFLRPEETRNTYGETVTVFQEWESRLASALQQGTRRYERYAQIYDELAVVYECPGFLALTTKHRLQHDGREYDIVAIETADNRQPERADELTIFCKRRS